MSEASLIFDSAWRQLDTRKRGHIPASDLPLLIDAIESNLSAPLVSSEQLEQVRQFERNSTQRVHKSDFKPLFKSLTGMDFPKAVNRAGWDKAVIDILQNDVLTSTPLRGVGVGSAGVGSAGVTNGDIPADDDKDLIQPSFKKEYKQYKRLSESQEKEIEYRDDVIYKLEQKEQELAKFINKYKESAKISKALEDDVLYRDRLIMERDAELKSKQLEESKLREEIKRWKEEAKMWQSQNEDEWKQYVLKKEHNFNNELLLRVQRQQKQIESLKLALSQNSSQVAQKPINIINAPVVDSTTKIRMNPLFTDFNKIPKSIIYMTLIVVILMIWFYPSSVSSVSSAASASSSHSSSKRIWSWYQGTWLEPYMYEWLENQSVDYDYYNLGDVNEEYLVSMR